MNSNSFSYLIVAAGRGMRAGGDIPKQYQEIAGVPLLARTLRACLDAAPHAPLYVVIHPQDSSLYNTLVLPHLRVFETRLRPPIMGGDTRQQSVLLGLEALREDAPAPYVLIHDGARPFLSKSLIKTILSQLHATPTHAVAPSLPLTDHIVMRDSVPGQFHALDRGQMARLQTPQAFPFDQILAAHRACHTADMPDDTSVARAAGMPLALCPGESQNIKLTLREDFMQAEASLYHHLADIRVGQGFDVHAFAPGDHVWLGGVKIPHTHSLSGHSDADVLIHAIVDAILGAIGEGDIGVHFPPSDPQWKGAASRLFLDFARDRLSARGGILAHVDATLICESPKLGPHREAICTQLSALLGVPLDRISVKATTSEKLGFTGRNEGMAALVTATIRLPVTHHG